MTETENNKRRYALTITVSEGDSSADNATLTFNGRYLGHLLAYALRALEPYMTDSEQQDVIADAIEGLPEDHPAHRDAKVTNRAIAGST